MWMESGKQGRNKETNNFATVHLSFSRYSDNSTWRRKWPLRARRYRYWFLEMCCGRDVGSIVCGDVMYLTPEQTHRIHVFCERCSTKWVRVVTDERSKHLAQLKQNTCKTQKQWNSKFMSKDEIQSLRQKCQNLQIKSHLQRKDKLLVTFFFILHRGSSFSAICLQCVSTNIFTFLAFQFSEAGFRIDKVQSNDRNYDLGIWLLRVIFSR